MRCLFGTLVVAAVAVSLQVLLPAWHLYTSEAEACKLQLEPPSQQRYVHQAAVNWYFGSQRLKANLTLPPPCSASPWRCEVEAFLFSFLAAYKVVHVPERCIEASGAAVRDPRRWYIQLTRHKSPKPQDFFCQSLLDYEHLPSMILEATWRDVEKFILSCKAEYKKLRSDLRHILDPIHSQGRVPEHLLRAHRSRGASSLTTSASPCLADLAGERDGEGGVGGGGGGDVPGTAGDGGDGLTASTSESLARTLGQELGCNQPALLRALTFVHFSKVDNFGGRSQKAGEALLAGKSTVVEMGMLMPDLNLTCSLEALAEAEFDASAMIHHNTRVLRERFAETGDHRRGSECLDPAADLAGLQLWLRRFPKPTHSLYLHHEAFQSSTRLHLLQPGDGGSGNVAFSNSDSEATLLTQVSGRSLVLLLQQKKKTTSPSSSSSSSPSSSPSSNSDSDPDADPLSDSISDCSRAASQLFQAAALGPKQRCDASRWLWLRGADMGYAHLKPGEAITIPPQTPYLVVSQQAGVMAASSIFRSWPTIERVCLDGEESVVQAAVRHFSLRTFLHYSNATGRRLVRTPAGVEWP